MKSLLLRKSTLFVSFILMLLACQKDVVKETNVIDIINDGNSMSIEEAKSWFEMKNRPEIELKAGIVGSNFKIGIKPDWGTGATSKSKDEDVVEVDLFVKGCFDFMEKPQYDEWNKAKLKGLKVSLTRMVFLKNRKTGKIEQFLMTFVGDNNYHKNQSSRILTNSYVNREKHFSGHVFYHDLSGNFVNGWKYEKGSVVASSSQTLGDPLPTSLKLATVQCSTYEIYGVYIDCTDWYRYGVWTNTTCGSPYMELKSTFTDCSTIGGGNSTVSGTKGDTNGGFVPPPTIPEIPCDCTNTCPICGGCLDNLKSTGSCEDCKCTELPLPVVIDELGSNQKAECIYQKLLKGYIMQYFIERYFGPTERRQSFLGELNLIWMLGSTPGNNAETLPIGKKNTAGSNIGIMLDETNLNKNPSIIVAMTMLHEALHARLIAEFYDQVGSTDFKALFAFYNGWGPNGGGLDKNQENEMFYMYSTEMATALQSFDQAQGVYNPINLYLESVKYKLSNDIYFQGYYQSGRDEFLTLYNSSKDCN